MTHKHAARPPSQRQLRVGEELRHVLSALFRRGDFRDPTLQTLNATVFVTPLGGQHLGDAVAALRRASAFLRGQVAREIDLRYAPALSFEADTSFEVASRIDSLLHLPEVARDLQPHPAQPHPAATGGVGSGAESGADPAESGGSHQHGESVRGT